LWTKATEFSLGVFIIIIIMTSIFRFID
jgi:hypothetical protein